MTHRLTFAACLLLLAAKHGGGQVAEAPLILVSTDGRQSVPTVSFDGRRMVNVLELAAPFDLTITDDRQDSRLSILQDDQVIVLTANQGLVSVAGQLVSLPVPPVERSGVWYVPLDFIGRALPLVHDQAVELRRRSDLVIIGDILVPQVVARYRTTGPQSRLRLMVTPATDHVIEQELSRLVITFDADAIDLVLPDVASDNLLTRLSGVETDPALAIELGESFGSYTSVREPAIGGGIELVIDLQPTTATTTSILPAPVPAASAPAAAVPDPNLPALSDLARPRAIRVIAIDPGHGGDDTGTRGPNGTLEKDVTLGVARRLRNAIESQLGLRVVLTRTGDTTVALDERAAIANNNRADLFISLHTNASIRETAAGAEVFYLSLAEYNEKASEATGQPVPVIGGGSRVLDIVPWEMAQLRYVNQSARWAETVADELSLRLPMSPRGIQQAPFRVLVGANMPSVLVELAFISNADQETQLVSTTFQSAIVNGLLRSIIRYRDEVTRGVPLSDQAATSPPDKLDTNQR